MQLCTRVEVLKPLWQLIFINFCHKRNLLEYLEVNTIVFEILCM